jgi:hypothetical protein
MDIRLLLSPDFLPRTKFSLPPMGIASLAASLREAGHRVIQDDLDVKSRQLDLDIFTMQDQVQRWLNGKPLPRLESTLEKVLSFTSPIKEGLIGLSVAEPSHLTTAVCIAKHVKEQTKATVVIGGRVSVNEALLRHPFVDYVITGDAEQAFPMLAMHLEGQASVKDVPGLAYRDSGVKHNGLQLPDLNELPAPDFKGLPIELYTHNALDTLDHYYDTYDKKLPISTDDHILMLPYLLSKGCAFSCSFCGVSAGKNQSVLYRKPEKIAEDTDRLSKQYNTKNFFFMDSTLNCDDAWLESVSDQLRGMDLLWSDSATPKKLGPRLLNKMRRAGCVRLTWGVESLSDPVLRKMRKPFTSLVAQQTLKDADIAGIWNYTNWIAGFPHETEQQLNQTLTAIRRSGSYIDDYTVTGFILQASDIHNNPQDYGISIGNKTAYLKSANDRMETDSFEEIGGLDWKGKQEHIQRSRESMVNVLSASRNIPLLVPMHTVFYLYSKFDDKDEIQTWLRSLYT